MAERRPKVQLSGVPETALWNLYHRAAAARAGRLDDPRALALVEHLDYPFERQLRQLPAITELSEVPQDGDDRLLRMLRAVPVLNKVLPSFPVWLARLGRACA